MQLREIEIRTAIMGLGWLRFSISISSRWLIIVGWRERQLTSRSFSLPVSEVAKIQGDLSHSLQEAHGYEVLIFSGMSHCCPRPVLRDVWYIVVRFNKTRKIPLTGITHDAKNQEVNFKAKSDN